MVQKVEVPPGVLVVLSGAALLESDVDGMLMGGTEETEGRYVGYLEVRGGGVE